MEKIQSISFIELLEKYQGKIELVPLIADIQDRELIFSIMAEYQPDVVYHAAAHKHVPLMEYNPHEAVKNNIFGTKNVAEAAKTARLPNLLWFQQIKLLIRQMSWERLNVLQK